VLSWPRAPVSVSWLRRGDGRADSAGLKSHRVSLRLALSVLAFLAIFAPSAVANAAVCPSVTGINPDHGPAAGGLPVTITGTNFASVTEVKFGGSNATFTLESSTEIRANPPAHTAGSSVSVTVIAPGCAPAVSPLDYTYDLPAPSITGISPNHGPAAGGTTVTITGTNLSGATAVKFGSENAESFSVNGPTEVTATAPPCTSGETIDVLVATPGGVSANTAADKYMCDSALTFGLTINNGGSGSGSVTCDGGSCASTYTEGTVLTLLAVAAPGSGFSGWSGASCSGIGACEVTITGDTVVTATYNVVTSVPPPACTDALRCPPERGQPHKGSRCRKGFKKRRVKGKVHCVKTRRLHKPKGKHGSRAATSLQGLHGDWLRRDEL
jgi:IPT/TIG domain/Divergent InlB B-repeat domain